MSSRSSTSAPGSTAARVVLGIALAGFGVAHLTIARQAFQAQVPDRLTG